MLRTANVHLKFRLVQHRQCHLKLARPAPMSKQIVSRVQAAFDDALASGDLLFFPSTVHPHEDSGVQFELRLCPALQHKPALPTPRFEGTPKSEHDPFAPPYIPGLLVGELEGDGGDYVILLNKYSVVPRHFLLVTKEFQSQSSPLLPSDLLQTYSLLAAARQTGDNFFAFFNCGDLSGASQHHKHVQFIPVEQGSPPIEKLAKSQNLEDPTKPFSLHTLPYANYIFRLPSSLPSSSPDDITDVLSQAFLQLLDLVIATMRHDAELPPGPPSYNVLLTLEHIHVIPRSQEKHVLTDTGESVSVNALGYAGMLLVKSDEEMEAVKREGVAKILSGVGMRSVQGEPEEP